MLRRVAAPLAVVLLLALPSTAGAEILITFIRYNPPGADTGSNASLNKEYVTIHNNADRRRY